MLVRLFRLIFGNPVKHWIQTFTGKKFFPLHPEMRLLDIRDQTRALSQICRYGGHTNRFYSVAEHAVRMSRRLATLGYGLEEQRQALVHDNTEAYLGDVPRPLKRQWQYWLYRKAEKRLSVLIMRWLHLPEAEFQIVKDLDTEILGTEAPILKWPLHPDWRLTTKTGALAEPWETGSETFDWGWRPERAEREYYRRFIELFGMHAWLEACSDDTE